ncbi:hypothetical protein [Dysgonomonas capnocytophagoides]|uniref:hypothetical protein n=1 Tax=Dysgonomonas capnocytophagoides TaxID=45254 RepID=UPI00291DA9C8|nr:hypothetical protein DCPSUM001_30790 [Dysgonomonas capnocytophagoides]
MAKRFSDTEKHIIELFSEAQSFTYEGIDYEIIESGKPRPSSGECKTDIYILAKDEKETEKEFKISVKQANADFLENKIKLERAIEILGDGAQDIIKNSIIPIQENFNKDYLVYFRNLGNVQENSITLGWKFEFLNKAGGKKCGQIILTDEQKIDIYAGTNLNSDKKNCKVNGTVINNSGIANYIINVGDNIDDDNDNVNYYASKMLPIEEFAKNQEIYFACKALNYRANKSGNIKWDGDRPLAVYVDWKADEDILKGEIIFDKPLSKKGHEIGRNLTTALNELNIHKDNFLELENKFDKNINYLK